MAPTLQEGALRRKLWIRCHLIFSLNQPQRLEHSSSRPRTSSCLSCAPQLQTRAPTVESTRMFVQKKADPAVARAELKRNVTVFLTAVLVVRALPYCLELFQKK